MLYRGNKRDRSAAARKLLEDQEPEARIYGWTTLKKIGPDLPLLSQPKSNLVHFILVATILIIFWMRESMTKFDQLILQKIIKIVATRIKCTKFDFGWGSAPDSAGELTVLPQSA